MGHIEFAVLLFLNIWILWRIPLRRSVDSYTYQLDSFLIRIERGVNELLQRTALQEAEDADS
jgi:hypothetical protein